VNPDALQRIAAAVTPAVMVSACGLLYLGLDNQTARMSTRLREIARELRLLDAEATALRAQNLRRQIVIFSRRHLYLSRALLLNYGAIAAFLATSMLALLQGQVRWIPLELTLVTFLTGVLLLAGMAAQAILSIQLSHDALRLEAADLAASAPPPAIRRASACGRAAGRAAPR
jgi:hypothetical protein